MGHNKFLGRRTTESKPNKVDSRNNKGAYHITGSSSQLREHKYDRRGTRQIYGSFPGRDGGENFSFYWLMAGGRWWLEWGIIANNISSSNIPTAPDTS